MKAYDRTKLRQRLFASVAVATLLFAAPAVMAADDDTSSDRAHRSSTTTYGVDMYGY